MSQHVLPTQCNGKAVEVLMGWDRPLQGFFLVIEVMDGESEEYLYSNLEDPALMRWMGLPPTLDPFLAKLKELGITVPQQMVQEVEADARLNVGNRYVTYDASGAIAS